MRNYQPYIDSYLNNDIDFTTFYHKMRPYITYFIRYYGRTTYLRDELESIFPIEFYKYIERMKNKQRPVKINYIARLFRHRFWNLIQKEKTKVDYIISYQNTKVLKDFNISLKQLVQDLPVSEDDRFIILMLLNGYQQTEIAAKFGYQQSWLSKRLNKIRQILKPYFKEK